MNERLKLYDRLGGINEGNFSTAALAERGHFSRYCRRCSNGLNGRSFRPNEEFHPPPLWAHFVDTLLPFESQGQGLSVFTGKEQIITKMHQMFSRKSFWFCCCNLGDSSKMNDFKRRPSLPGPSVARPRQDFSFGCIIAYNNLPWKLNLLLPGEEAGGREFELDHCDIATAEKFSIGGKLHGLMTTATEPTEYGAFRETSCLD